MIRILHVVPSIFLRSGGPAKAVVDLSNALVPRGFEVSVFATEDRDNIGGEYRSFERNGVQYQLYARRWLKKYGFSSTFARGLEQQIKKVDLVDIHSVWCYATAIAGHLCRKHKIPYLMRPCGMLDSYCLSHHWIKKRLYHYLVEGNNLRKAEIVHFTTEEERDRSIGYGSKDRGVVIPLGVRLEEYLTLPPRGSFRKDYPQLAGKKVILFLGRISFKKGLDLVVDAMSNILKKRDDAHWVIAGPDDEGYGKKLNRMIREKGIGHAVTLTGFLDGERKLALFRDSDIFCHPSYQENFGLSVVEAMATGLPVVVSDQVNIHDQISAAKAGMVSACESGEVTLALERLLENDKMRLQMGVNAKRLVSERYEWNDIVQSYAELYERVLKDCRDRSSSPATSADQHTSTAV